MKKENIEAKDKEFRDKLKEMRMNLAIRQVQANQKESKPRNHIKVVVPLLMVLVVALYFVGNKMRSHHPVSATIPYKVKIAENKPEVAPDQTESDGTYVETQNKSGSHSGDILIADSNKEAPSSNVSPFVTEVENRETPFETHVATSSEGGNEQESKNQTTDAIVSGEEQTYNGLGSPANKDMETQETAGINSATPPPSSVGTLLPHRTRITQNLVCSGVKARKCVAPKSVFLLNENRNPHVWMEVYSDSVPYTLKHVYYHEGRKYVEVPLKIEYRRMRTWSYITLKDSPRVGSWHVDTVDEDGTVLGRVDFKVAIRR
jgi:hypothetical protein